MIAREGDLAPGTTGDIILVEPAGFALNAADNLVFSAKLSGSGVPSDAGGLWLWSQGGLDLLFGHDDKVEIAPGILKRIVSPRVVGGGNTSGALSGFSDAGHIAFRGKIIGVGQGVFVIAPSNTAPVADAGGPYLVAAGGEVTLDGSASSDPDGDPLIETWTADGGTVSGNTYTAGTVPGIYDVQLVVNDGQVDSPPASTTVVVFDPTGNFITGGGWIDSPEGAYKDDLSLTGKANFGFVSRYKKGASVPTGQTEFNFKAGDLNFHSDSYQWLVVNQGGTNAQYKGTGTINGDLAPTGDEYKFMLWASDGDHADPVEADTFRIKIWYEDGGEVVGYDNGFNQPIGGGSIVIHSK